MVTIERVNLLFNYDPATGYFTNQRSRGRAGAGARAGADTGHGYRRIIIDYVKYYEHQLAWYITHGYWPLEIDHKDGDGTNNAIENLRLATRTQNNFNSERATGESGLKGAYLDKRTTRWYSKIQIGGIVHHLGMFDSAEEAHKAFMIEVEHHHGEFALHNRTPELEAI